MISKTIGLYTWKHKYTYLPFDESSPLFEKRSRQWKHWVESGGGFFQVLSEIISDLVIIAQKEVNSDCWYFWSYSLQCQQNEGKYFFSFIQIRFCSFLTEEEHQGCPKLGFYQFVSYIIYFLLSPPEKTSHDVENRACIKLTETVLYFALVSEIDLDSFVFKAKD